MQKIRKWISPLILTIICHQVVRIVTDISEKSAIWSSPVLHFKEFLICIPPFYFFDWMIHASFKKHKLTAKSPAGLFREYAIWALFVATGIIGLVYSIRLLLTIPHHLKDYVLAAVTLTPILLLYYTLTRDDYMHNRLRDQNLQLEKIKNEKLVSDMKCLKAQYHPHFLFNALNTVYFQIADQNSAAKATVELLSDLLRYQIYHTNGKVTLREEIDFLEKYLRFQKLRTDDSMMVIPHIDVEDKNTELHPLLFQPLMENALKHSGGDPQIDFYVLQYDNIVCFLTINGIVEGAYPPKNGVGLRNLKQRLAILYFNKFELTTEVRGNRFYASLIIQTDQHENTMCNS